MKVVVSKVDLLNVIAKIQGIIPTKPSIPILSNVLLEAVDDQLILSGTDLAVSMRSETEAKVIEKGGVAIPARRFFQLVREITAPQIKISVQANEIVEITTGTSVFKINGMSPAEFPQIGDLSASPSISFPQSQLKEMLLKTAFSAAREDSRYMLNGVHFQISQQKAAFLGTDGKRLAKTVATFAQSTMLQGSYVIPLKAVEEMGKLLTEGETPVTLNLSQDKIALECGPTLLIAKLLSGQYPDVEKVIPTKFVGQLTIHREELMSLLRQVSLFTSETSNSVRFSFEAGQLQLAAMSSEIGEGRVSMPVDYSGKKLEIAFNPLYFLDILRHSKDETVRFGFNDAHNPGLITDSTNALFVIMPMRLNEVSPPSEPAPAHASS